MWKTASIPSRSTPNTYVAIYMSLAAHLIPPTAVRVERNTARRVNERIAEETRERVASYHSAGKEELSRRIEALDCEWDIERVLEANAATISLAGAVLALTVNRKFAWIPAAVGGFLFQHAIQGWCPPIPVLRRAGVRTAREINEERLALMRLRGDFDEPYSPDPDI